MRAEHSRGFSLVEVVAAITLLSVGVAGLMRVLSSFENKLVQAENIHMTASYVRGCVERLVAARRYVGFSAVTDTTAAGYCPSDSAVTMAVAAATVSNCPVATAGVCRQYTVTATRNGSSSSASILLVDY